MWMLSATLLAFFHVGSAWSTSTSTTGYPVTFGTAISQGNMCDDRTKSGSGFISYLWWTEGQADGYVAETILNYYVDNNPPITVTLDILAGIGFGDPTSPWVSPPISSQGTDHFGKGAATGGVYSTLRVPFTSQIKITATAPTSLSSAAVFWFIVRGVSNAPILLNGYPLPSNAQLKLYSTVEQQIQPLTYVPLVNTKNAGLVWAHTLAVQSANLNYLEGCYRAYIQSATEPWLLSSGTEDYFQSAFYFNAGPFHFPEAGLSHQNQTQVHNYDAFWFESGGFEMTWRVGEYMDPATGLKCVDNGTIVGNPQPSIVTAYTWTYEW